MQGLANLRPPVVLACAALLAACGGGDASPGTDGAIATVQTSTPKRGWTAPATLSPEVDIQVGWELYGGEFTPAPSYQLPLHSTDNLYLARIAFDAAGRALATWGSYPTEWLDWHYHAHFATAQAAWRPSRDAGWTTLDAPGFHIKPEGGTQLMTGIAGDGQPIGASLRPSDVQCFYSITNYTDDCVRELDVHPLVAPESRWTRLHAAAINLSAPEPMLRPDGSGIAVWAAEEGTPRLNKLHTATRTGRTAAWKEDARVLDTLDTPKGYTGAGALQLADCGSNRMILIGSSFFFGAPPDEVGHRVVWARIRERSQSRWGPLIRLVQNLPTERLAGLTLRVDKAGKPHLGWITTGDVMHHLMLECDAKGAVTLHETLPWPNGIDIYGGLQMTALSDGGMAFALRNTLADGPGRDDVRWRSASGTWSRPVTVPSDNQPTSLVIDHIGNIAAVWSDDPGDFNADDYIDKPYTASSIRLLRYWRTPARWDAPRTLSAADGDGIVRRNARPLITVAPDCRLAVAWLRARRETDPAAAHPKDRVWAVVDVQWAETR
ncbi:hypothetical protein [Derxia gummosa]|uniref:Lipoprotein n=1 Tax=Derxia gummosa DSM 723 TaxID=1121388 RepID=A0A8B6X499_9BURK|nr:hypothetical protein [Derxia gummosa]